MNKNTNRSQGMVSVIIPVYNCEKTIDECVHSIKEQTYENWEIIIIDDGSTDKTYKKANAWTKTDLRIKVFRQENQGSGPARNRGMEKASGEYIAFLDGDDFWQNKYALKKIMDAIKGKNYDVIGTFYCSYRDGKFIKVPRHREYFTPEEESGKWIAFRDEQDCYGYCSYLYRRSFLEEGNIVFPPYRRFQDPPFLVNVMIRAKKYYVLPIEWSSYRHRYKNVLLTEEKINDFLKGVLDIVKVAQVQRMIKLIADVTNRVNYHSGVIIKSILQGNTEALRLTAELQECIKDEEVENSLFQFITCSIKAESQRTVSMFIREISKISKLIIYGAGSYGQHFFERISKYNLQSEIVFAQTNKPQNRVVRERLCYSLDELKEYNEDALVIIAVKDKKMQDQMISNLKAMGFKKYQLYIDNLIIALECAEGVSQ